MNPDFHEMIQVYRTAYDLIAKQLGVPLASELTQDQWMCQFAALVAVFGRMTSNGEGKDDERRDGE